jgi:hypothetical protein
METHKRPASAAEHTPGVKSREWPFGRLCIVPGCSRIIPPRYIGVCPAPKSLRERHRISPCVLSFPNLARLDTDQVRPLLAAKLRELSAITEN